MIKFKEPDMEQEFYRLDARLKVIAYAIAGLIGQFSKHLIITSIVRQNSATHEDFRAFDARTVNLSGSESDEVVQFINTHVDYGDGVHAVIKDERKPGSSPSRRRRGLARIAGKA